MAAVVDVARPNALPRPLHLLNSSDVSVDSHEDINQPGRGTFPIKGPDITGACTQVIVLGLFAVVVIRISSFIRVFVSIFIGEGFLRGGFQIQRITRYPG